ncbi:EamA family transporter, partial [Kineococcus glutinatus]|uniref:EamA family transporter n=1 Tax=Kineococcus glutinatus TaxID=1070872 RepID=UPI0031ECE4DB
ALLVLGPGLAGRGTPVDAAGVGLAVAAGASYAVYSLIGGDLIGRGRPPGAVMGVLFGAAGVLVLPVAVLGGADRLAGARGAAVVLHLAVFTVYLAYRLFGLGLRRTPASVATSLTLAEPAVAAVLGVAVLGERLPVVSWCGLAVLGVGLALLAVPGRRRRGVRQTGR